MIPNKPGVLSTAEIRRVLRKHLGGASYVHMRAGDLQTTGGEEAKTDPDA